MDVDEDISEAAQLGQRIVDAILERQPRTAVDALLAADAPLWFQASDGTSALHAAAYSQDADLVRNLLEKGAVWNSVDELGNTAGDVALSLNDGECYELIRDAGIRTEMLLTLLSQKNQMLQAPSTLLLKTSESTAAGDTHIFLSSKLQFQKDARGQDVCLVDTGSEVVGVMMGWESEIMKRTVRELCDDHELASTGLKILNIGFGLGIIDTLFETLPTAPSTHVIVEAHPDVLEHMRRTGWMVRPNVKVLEGKWQDFVENDLLAFGGFDVVYTDTFSEDYLELRKFFEHLPDLLAGPESRFSFFHGLGATNALFYDVYTRLAELHLLEIGLDTVWREVRVGEEVDEQWGTTRKYFTMPWYRLPVCCLETL